MKELTTEEKIQCLEYCIEEIPKWTCGICTIVRYWIEQNIGVYRVSFDSITNYIPEFVPSKSIPPSKHLLKEPLDLTIHNFLWWPYAERDIRIEYCKELITKIKENEKAN